jgi:hypothetical protein
MFYRAEIGLTAGRSTGDTVSNAAYPVPAIDRWQSN